MNDPFSPRKRVYLFLSASLFFAFYSFEVAANAQTASPQASASTVQKTTQTNSASTKPSEVVSKNSDASSNKRATRPFTATAYSLRGRTASGRHTSEGIIAADHHVLPLGTRVRLDAGNYSGEYLVADTGGMIRGSHIDIWVPDTHEARRFGRRPVKLTVLEYGARKNAKARKRR